MFPPILPIAPFYYCYYCKTPPMRGPESSVRPPPLILEEFDCRFEGRYCPRESGSSPIAPTPPNPPNASVFWLPCME